MEWSDDAYVLAARVHGESGAIVDLLTESRGRYVAHVAGGASRRMKPFLQPGARVIMGYRSRTSEQLSSAQLEPENKKPTTQNNKPQTQTNQTTTTAETQNAQPEREAH